MIVIKRDGREVDFDKSKIFNAVYKAVIEVDKIIPQKDKETLASDIANKLQKKYNKLNRAITVEDIQDDVETELMKSDAYEIAKAYITYRY